MSTIFSRNREADLSEEYGEDDFSEEELNVQVDENGNAVEQYEALERQERAIERKKDSLFARLFKKKEKPVVYEDFSDGVEVYDEKRDSEEVAQLKADMKKLGVICYDLIKMLDEPEFKRFKLSEDFIEYKAILKKHNLVRNKY